MLGKLIKYEIKATARIFLPLYAVLLVYAVIHKIISLLTPSRIITPEVISTIIYVMLLIAIFVMTFVVMIQRFYKNLLSDEGYLMFTLPTKPWKLILSKLFISVIWSLTSLIAAFASICIIAGDQIFTSSTMHGLYLLMSQMYEYFGITAPLLIIELIIGSLASLVSSILMIYASISIGQLFNKHRVLASFGAYIGLNTVAQIIVSILSIPGIWLGLGSFIPDNPHPGVQFVQIIIAISVLFTVLLSAGYYFISNYILSRHLNLE